MSEDSTQHGLRRLAGPRRLLPDERDLISQLLTVPFVGRDEIRQQLASVSVVAVGTESERTIRLRVPDDSIRAPAIVRVPVSGYATDLDGVPIEVLLHVVDGVALELEIYRVDGAPIKRPVIGPLSSVGSNEG